VSAAVLVEFVRLNGQIAEAVESLEEHGQVALAIAPALLADDDLQVTAVPGEPLLTDLPRIQRQTALLQVHVAGRVEHHTLAELV